MCVCIYICVSFCVCMYSHMSKRESCSLWLEWGGCVLTCSTVHTIIISLLIHTPNTHTHTYARICTYSRRLSSRAVVFCSVSSSMWQPLDRRGEIRTDGRRWRAGGWRERLPGSRMKEKRGGKGREEVKGTGEEEKELRGWQQYSLCWLYTPYVGWLAVLTLL